MKKIILVSIPVIIIGILAFVFIPNQVENFEDNRTFEEIHVAFIGDQGGSEFLSNDKKVLELIKNENVDLVIHQGDLGFEPASPDEWDKMITENLGSDFVYLVSEGHHDQESWDDYQPYLKERIEKNSDIDCKGNLGVKSICNYKDINIVLIAPGEYTSDSDFDLYVEEELNRDESFWKICSMHNELTAMETERKSGKTGMEVFEACKNAGAIIATGHHHVYSRTGNIIEFINSKEQVSDPKWTELNRLKISKGSTFMFTSGLAGSPVSHQINDWPVNYSSKQNATYGGLFCTFNAGGQPNKAFCYFKNIEQRIIDEFTITSDLIEFSNNLNFINGDFSNSDFSNDDFSNEVLVDSIFKNVKFTNADLSNSILIGSILSGADLSGTNLSGVSLATTDLTGVKLVGADLSGAKLSGADLSEMDLYETNLSGADLSDSNLSGMDLYETNLDETNLAQKDLSNSKFYFISLKDTKMDNVDLSFTNIREVDFTKIKNKDLSNSNLFKTGITFSNLKNVDISNTTISESSLHNSDLSGIDFTKIKDRFIHRVNFENAKLEDANFSGMKFIEKNPDGLVKVETSSPTNIKIFEEIEKLGINEAQALFNYSNEKLTQLLWDGNFYATLVIDKKIVNGVLKIYYVSTAQFQNADLTNVDFSNADLTYTLLGNTNLSGANLSGADLTRAYLVGANLNGANLAGADLNGANLAGADLTNTFLEKTNLKCLNHEICE